MRARVERQGTRKTELSARLSPIAASTPTVDAVAAMASWPSDIEVFRRFHRGWHGREPG